MTPQHLTALSKANQVRLAAFEQRKRIESIKDLHASMAECAAVLEERHDFLRNKRVWVVLDWCHRMQDRQVRRFLRYARIYDQHRLVGQLTDRQIGRLAAVLRDPSLLEWDVAA